MDAEELHKGVEIRALPRSIVLFICKYDPFGIELLKYSFQNICLENNDAELNDRVKRWRLDNEKARIYMTHEQELIEAKAEGRAEIAEAIAEKMLRKGSDVETILELTELSMEQINKIVDRIGVKLVMN